MQKKFLCFLRVTETEKSGAVRSAVRNFTGKTKLGKFWCGEYMCRTVFIDKESTDRDRTDDGRTPAVLRAREGHKTISQPFNLMHRFYGFDFLFQYPKCIKWNRTFPYVHYRQKLRGHFPKGESVPLIFPVVYSFKVTHVLSLNAK